MSETSPARPETSLAPGTEVGRYVILSELGSGGMGSVYAAFDAQLARRVAIKVVRPDTDTPVARARMLGEAQAMARLTHPNVVAIYDVGLFRDAVFLAMEYVDGPTLKVWLRDAHPWRDALATLVAAGRGLAAAHAAGLVHRDFKPDNVLIGRDGRVRVGDFGIARAEHAGEERPDTPSVPVESSRTPPKPPGPPVSAGSFPSFRLDSSSASATLTLPGALIGTVGYMAPERAFEGQDDARSDQFAFCETLYLALYGRHPFDYTDLKSYLDAICLPPRPPPSDSKVPAWVAAAVLRGLSIEPADRFATMQDLLDALGRDPRPRRRRLLGAIAALGVAAVTALALTHQSRAREQACRDEGSAVRDVWSLPAQEGARAAFARSGVNDQERLWEVTRAGLDGYARRWSESSVSACRAATIEHTESVTLLRRSRACLRTRLLELGQLARSLGDADAKLVRKGPNLVSSLAPIESCADRDELLSSVDPPGGPGVEARVADLRGAVAEARALETSIHDAEARARIVPVVEEARRIGFAPLLAEALVERGSLERPADGEATLVEAYDVALSSRRFVTAGHASGLLTDLVGHVLGRHKEGHVWARLGEAALGDATSFEADDVRMSILLDETYIYDEEGDAPNAISSAERATAIASRHGPPDEALAQRLHVAMAVAQSTGGDLAAARREFRVALESAERRLGPGHPTVADRLSDLAAVEINDAHYDVGVSDLDRSIAINEAIPDGRQQSIAVCLLNRAQALRRMTKCDLALADTARAATLYGQEHGADTEDMVTIETIAADCHRILGHAAEATSAIERAEKIAAASPDTRIGALIEMRFAHAQILGFADPRGAALAKQARDDGGAPTTPDEEREYAEMDEWLARSRAMRR